jgi:S1-C subfamily serine protease
MADDGAGITEGFKGRAVRMQSLTLGDVAMTSPVVQLIAPDTIDSGRQAADGLMGLDVLRRLNLFVDAGDNSLWIKPNALLGRPFSYNRSGLTLRRAKGHLVVVAALPDTPAAKAGLVPGDVIHPPPGLSPLRFVQSLSDDPGVVLSFQAERDGKAFPVRLVLQDLI